MDDIVDEMLFVTDARTLLADLEPCRRCGLRPMAGMFRK